MSTSPMSPRQIPAVPPTGPEGQPGNTGGSVLRVFSRRIGAPRLADNATIGRTEARRAALAVFAIIIAGACPGQGATGRQTMTESREIVLEGAGGRRPSGFLVMRLTGLEREGRGLFGLRQSPAMPGYVPDAHSAEGEILLGAGGKVHLRAPGAEFANAGMGGLLVLGMVDDGHCICILHPPAGMAAEQAASWAAGQACG